MPGLISPPPVTEIEPVTDVLHGVQITDPYRWLEDQKSPRTRAWIDEQTFYARAYLDNIPRRERIRGRVREFLAVETHDSVRTGGGRYFFRKRLPEQEQPCIYMRESPTSEDRLLVDPFALRRSKYTSVRPLRASSDGRLLLYEVKEGGERTAAFEILDVDRCRTLSDRLPRGYLRSFAFTADTKDFYYVHEPLGSLRPFYRAAYLHVLGTGSQDDQEVFCAGEDEKLRLQLVVGTNRLGILIRKFSDKTLTTLYVKSLEGDGSLHCVAADAEFGLCPVFIKEKILAITDCEAPNSRIVELRLQADGNVEWVEIVPESGDRIRQWAVAGDRILVFYSCQAAVRVLVFDLEGRKTNEWPARTTERTVRILSASPDSDEVVIESESFTEPPVLLLCSARTSQCITWAKRNIPFQPDEYGYERVWYCSKDGTPVPMFLMGRRDALKRGCHPVVMTSYGGYGVSMTPLFSIFVAFLVEHGCLFALPNIRGGSEFGAQWHSAAKRQNRQTAYDDFLAAAEWLIFSGRTAADKLAIFGGSNSGLLVGAALTQRPDLFRAAVCIAPMLDMLRYHLFDNAHVWRGEFGVADDPGDFAALARYSPYHRVGNATGYPATLFVSGDADQNCNPMHARKIVARLQAANSSGNPILLDYSRFRGHSPVLPLSDRIDSLTDRLAFVCDQLGVHV